MKKQASLLISCILFASCSLSTNTTNTFSESSNSAASQSNLTSLAANTNNTVFIISKSINTNTNFKINIPMSREQTMENCRWQTYISKSFHLGFQYQACQNDKNTFLEKDNTLWFGDKKFMEINTMAPEESNTHALKRAYFSKLQPIEQQNCRITTESVYSTSERTDRNIERYEFEEMPGITHANDSPGEYCGDHGLTNGMRYFEFQKDANFFAFIDLGQDSAWFGRDTLTFLP